MRIFDMLNTKKYLKETKWKDDTIENSNNSNIFVCWSYRLPQRNNFHIIISDMKYPN